jgi:hypothetical protein
MGIPWIACKRGMQVTRGQRPGHDTLRRQALRLQGGVCGRHACDGRRSTGEPQPEGLARRFLCLLGGSSVISESNLKNIPRTRKGPIWGVWPAPVARGTQNVGGEAPHLLEGYSVPPGPARPHKSTIPGSGDAFFCCLTTF